MDNIDELKRKIKQDSSGPTYKLSNANVFVSPCGWHYTDYLDVIDTSSAEIDETQLTEQEVIYIEKLLQSNMKRLNDQVNFVKCYNHVLKNKRVLDVGCGGGLFLSKLRNEDAIVMGIELSDSRATYAKRRHNLEIIKRPIEDSYWERYESSFDIITLWDVIEHVNYPLQTLTKCQDVLVKGGIIFVDTPCRDSFFHWIGEFTYKFTKGRYPTFLNAMYSSHKFGHKQIFSIQEIKYLFTRANLEILEVKQFLELSFPYIFYLKKMFRSNFLAGLFLPIATVLIPLLPIKNKMLVVGRKKIG